MSINSSKCKHCREFPIANNTPFFYCAEHNIFMCRRCVIDSYHRELFPEHNILQLPNFKSVCIDCNNKKEYIGFCGVDLKSFCVKCAENHVNCNEKVYCFTENTEEFIKNIWEKIVKENCEVNSAFHFPTKDITENDIEIFKLHNQIYMEKTYKKGTEKDPVKVEIPKLKQEEPSNKKPSWGSWLTFGLVGGTNKPINYEEMLKDNKYIYSIKNWHPFSFLTGHRKFGVNQSCDLLNAPSPLFIENELWLRKPDLSKKGYLEGVVIDNKKGLLLVSEEISQKFKGILVDLIAQLLKVISGHKISMKVRLFQPRSLTQTYSYYWMNLPKFIPKCTDANMTPLERMKNVMAFAISGLYLGSMALKPFNPLISETFQGYFDTSESVDSSLKESEFLENFAKEHSYSEYNNKSFLNKKIDINKIEPKDKEEVAERTEVYTEQTSNYPTVTRFYVHNRHFIMHGYFDISLKMENMGNKIVTITKGYTTVEFPEINEKITYTMPNAKLLNAIGQKDRSAYYLGVMSFVDVKNGLRGLVKFGENAEKIHELNGIIFKSSFGKDFRFSYDSEFAQYNKLDIFITPEIMKNTLAILTGSWLEKLKIDNKVYWDIDKDIPTWIRPCTNCLPSDSRFREDLIWLFRSFYCAKNDAEKARYEDLANEWKLMLEKLQRTEREHKAKQAEERAKLASAKINK